MATYDSTYEPSHFGLCVSDLDRSVRFYTEGLGFEVAERYDLDSAEMPGLDKALEVEGRTDIVSLFIRKGGMAIELLHYKSPGVVGAPSAHRNQLGLTHLSFYVDDVDQAAARLVEAGGTILPDTRQSAGILLMFVADPDGVRVELMSNEGR